MEQIKRCAFNQRGELCDTIKNLFKDKDKQYIPVFGRNGYRIDWSIIGLEYEKYFGWGQLIDNTLYPVCPLDLDWHTWVKIIRKVQKWIIWLSTRLFYPETMIGSKHTTDLVRLRIAVAMLDKLGLPKTYADNMFYNLLECYWARKYVYDTYYYKYILEIPF